MGMLTDKVFFHIQFGQNNINFTQNSGPSNAIIYFRCYREYHFNDQFHLGGGLTAWVLVLPAIQLIVLLLNT
jgi:hypothetical protein